MKQIILNYIDVEIWNNLHVQFQPHSDVNIIMGSNGSGKTTFLRNLYQSLAEDKESKDYIIYLPSIDNIAMRDKRKTATALSQELDYYIYDMKTGPSLMSLRMSILDSSEEKRIEMKAKIADFQKVINDFFAMTGKTHRNKRQQVYCFYRQWNITCRSTVFWRKANSIDFAESVPAKWKRSHRNDR